MKTLQQPNKKSFFRRKLLSVSIDPKTTKGEKFGFLTGILYLAPLTIGGFGNLCPFASAGCAAACLNTAGRGAMSNVQRGRIAKTALFFKANRTFLENLVLDIRALVKKSAKQGLSPVVRLNGTSDIAWERLKLHSGKSIFQEFPEVIFYDYTKNPTRAIENARGEHPKNYSLTFSRSEENDTDAVKILSAGGKVAIVFRFKVPKYHEFPSGQMFRVIVGDESDLRFLDKGRQIVGLVAKGRAKKDTSGFVI
jgi:hypothetical protein